MIQIVWFPVDAFMRVRAGKALDDRAATASDQSERLTAIGVMFRGPGTARVPEAV